MKKKLKRLLELLRDRENQKRYLHWLIANTKPYIGTLAFFLAIDIIGVVISFASTIVSKYVVDAATVSTEFVFGFMLMIIISVFNIALSAVVSLISTVLNEKYSFGIRVKVFDKILRSDWLKLSKYHSGDLLTRFTSDVDTVTSGISSIIPALITLIIRLVIAFCMLFYYTRALALIALILGPVGALMAVLFGEKLKKISVQVKESEAKYRSYMQESIANVSVLKAFRGEESGVEKLTGLRNERLDVILKRNRLNVSMSVVIRAVYSLGYLCAFGFGLFGLSNGTLSFGTMTLLISLVSQIQGPIMSLANLIPQFVGVLASSGRIMEIEDIGNEPDSGTDAEYESVGIRFDGVDFTYTGEKILENVSFELEPGRTLGIVGKSGVGKTTLIRLVLAFIKPECGTVSFYDGDTVETADAATRRFIAYVPQGNTLMSGSIAENIRYGKPDADENEIWEALTLADADEFIRALPDGLNTLITERAGGLSEGQAQRIAIARALICKSPVLILDEATAALDSETESRILNRLAGQTNKPTCLIITHRRQMLDYCDCAIEIADRNIQFIKNISD